MRKQIMKITVPKVNLYDNVGFFRKNPQYHFGKNGTFVNPKTFRRSSK